MPAQPETGAKDTRGSVTAELAVVLPAITVLLALLLLAVSVGLLQLKLEEGARAGARALARGDATEQVYDIVARISGEAASVTISGSDGFITVTVQGQVDGVLSGLISWPQLAQASAKIENPPSANSLLITAVEKTGSHGHG